MSKETILTDEEILITITFLVVHKITAPSIYRHLKHRGAGLSYNEVHAKVIQVREYLSRSLGL